MKRILAIASALAVVAGSVSAGPFRSESGLKVYGLDAPGTFEVIERGGAGPRRIWCAAADYAQSALGAPRAQRIYIIKGSSRSVNEAPRESVAFTINPTAQMEREGGSNSGVFTVSTTKVGFSISGSKARRYCEDRFRLR